jgi:hypothetical protein
VLGVGDAGKVERDEHRLRAAGFERDGHDDVLATSERGQ